MQFGDAIPKLNGLARYTEMHWQVFRRIEAIAKVGEQLRVLDLTNADVRNAVYEAKDAKSLYESSFASKY